MLKARNEQPKQRQRQSVTNEFLLLEFSDIRELQILHFTVFLVVYLAALLGNLLIITAVAYDHHLHTPMYFFLVNLALLDLCYISVTVPKSMANSLTNSQLISFIGCVAQVFLVVAFTDAELTLLTVMAYDRYIAICQPLHYNVIMTRNSCAQMAAGCWISSLVSAVLYTSNVFRLPCCLSNIVGHFFCDMPHILKLSTSDTHDSEILVHVFGTIAATFCFVLIVVTYVNILSTVMRIPSVQGRHKAFSTCLPHLIVFCLFLGTAAFAYMKPSSLSSYFMDLLAAISYSVLPPLVNPIIYSLRNKDLKGALMKILWKRNELFTLFGHGMFTV